MSDYHDDIFAEAVACSTASGLIASRPATPLRAQVRIFQGALARAKAAGLRLPERFHLLWMEGHDRIAPGAASRDANGSITVYLSVNAMPYDLERTSLHELQHLADYVSGYDWSQVEMEMRATEFAARMMRWR
jgi:hypothetical protein